MKHILSVNVDEVGKNIPEIVPFLKRNNIKHLELRTIDEKNIANFQASDLQLLKQQIAKYGFHVSALASPLFKWYMQKPDTIQVYDSFNFPCILSQSDKIESIDRVINNAEVLKSPKIRVFTGLSNGNPCIEKILEDDTFEYCLNQGKERGVSVLVENEPVCNVSTLKDIYTLLSNFQNLDLWLDIANFYQIGEKFNLSNLEELLPRVQHVHLKDIMFRDGEIQYVPLGDGDIPWEEFLYFFFEKSDRKISFSIETHVAENKIVATEKSISFYRRVEEAFA
ncbi:MAG: sugar phosphate isomerase/epimerase [Microcoleus sp. PH2017_10_PVI_O_A]|uniref:sugar phosphate isomerase/epimerase family protein n=1 Tax=unclassified Microcoleus TaxID=2642155 RepID=UPI001D6FA095|nr:MULTISPECIES: TIM barrel protein [unclassified Microcoleus]MCC3407951.1 sugar phosphate isomerase/epimerase [Microcoleus sp. PH2017_10_PVI_O_A]MCC3462122.1 sugar phosphate isomerase/epimerase [Microcoleus sp. PH2017_11_PCY_U_A]MCC3480555.1 sugar phosphate isomerase/epimerase [Microcoleus sp. PH2017_12_PCY_D_A]MCC3529963.1 sugar phosphate isomerase/epimerase [Microcoleus sp. PH2017_21_RUC_O_A]MCC3542257.1 sugar phosphate isomerase/epimerase [Microcoleus sp. PH2017_22_RUC_O_B]